MSTTSSLGDIYIWNRNEIDPKPQEALRGRKWRQLSGSQTAIVGVDGDGKLTWLVGEPDNALELQKALEPINVVSVAIGDHHAAVIGGDGSLHTWGTGSQGQLGLGYAAGCSEPEMVLSSLGSLHAMAASCGGSHTAVVTEQLDLYTFGRGHEGQIGHGERPSQRIALSPTYVKGLFGVKVRGVACGCDFTLACSSLGAVFSWGAGGMGQLGTGRVTQRSTPQQLSINNTDVDPVDCVAAGWAHALASTKAGVLYSWGFNAYGQLGLGDKKTRFKPELVTCAEDPDFVVSRPEASKHYSASLTASGRLYTWGSSNGCLGHGPDADGKGHMVTPSRVPGIESQTLRMLSLSGTSMAAFARTAVLNLWPRSGPTTGGTSLRISGSGFFPIPGAIITVCFVAPDMPPQFVEGRLDPVRGVIECVVPAWNEEEEVEEEEEGVVYEDESDAEDDLLDENPPRVVMVEVSINGIDYTSDKYTFEYFEQAHITAVGPPLLPASGGPQVVIQGDGFVECSDLKVRFLELRGPGDEVGEARCIVVPGTRRLRDAAPLSPGVEVTEELLHALERNRIADIVCTSPILEGPLPCTCKVSVALNGSDFTEDVATVVFFDSSIGKVQPDCGLATGSTVIQLIGSGFVKGAIPRVRFNVGTLVRNVTGVCVSSQVVQLKAPSVVLGLTVAEETAIRTALAPLDDKGIEKLWNDRASKQEPRNQAVTVQLSFDGGENYGPPAHFRYFTGDISSVEPALGPVQGGTNLAIVANGSWLFASTKLGVRFECPKFEMVVTPTLDESGKVLRVKSPALLTAELMAPLAKLEIDLAADLAKLATEDTDNRKKLTAAFDKAKANFQKGLPKYKVNISVTLNGVDFATGKGLAFTYFDPVKILGIAPEVAVAGDAVTLTGENMGSLAIAKVILIRFTYQPGPACLEVEVVSVAGKFVKESGNLIAKLPAFELPPDRDHVLTHVSISLNDGADWSLLSETAVTLKKAAEAMPPESDKGKKK